VLSVALLCGVSEVSSASDGGLALDAGAPIAPEALTATVPADAGSEDPYEWKVFPVASYNSDIGFEFGAFGVVNRLGPPGIPYHWSLSAQAAVSVKGGPNGQPELPVHDDNLNLDWRSLDARWRVRAGVWFWQAANAGFYGLGNQSPANGAPAATSVRPTQYTRSELVAQASAAYQVLSSLRVRVGLEGRRIAPIIYPGSTLDLERSEPLLVGLTPHVSVLGFASVELDTRDQEIDPTHGVWLEASVRGSPGALTGNTFSFGAVTGHARVYQELWPGRLVLAGRVMVDAAFGQPPLHELSRGGFTEVWMMGGSDGVQGIPEGRYQGRIRLAMNLELRAHLFQFGLFGQHFGVGMVGFADAGRVWADWTPRPDLDGTGVGLHPSFGGGLRLRWGETVMVRFDVAWAPAPASTRDEPIGIYFDLGHIF
jgi:hypothetical protein